MGRKNSGCRLDTCLKRGDFKYTVMNVMNKSNENFKTTIPSKNYDRPKTTKECGIYLNIWVTF